MNKPDRPSAISSAGATTAESARLFDLLNPAVQAQRLYLEDVTVHLAGSHRTVSVVVDLPEDQSGSVALDAIADISRELSLVMDTDPHDDGRPYDLEVSSPGVGRPLTEPRHWRRARGRMVTLTPVQGEKVTGRLLEVDDDGVTLRPELTVKKGMKPKQVAPVQMGFEQIRHGSVEVEFSRLNEHGLDADGEQADDDTAEEEES
ncbi:ribosome maturation factor RimP [Paenarthrobacter sp. Z7-10]|uniref:ribosome maturation factor RimP n=1 Tax=Paenarthrobacter sp. Z7-10 TaxID=2787635 RepID=UPI002E793932|nr:ribosome maturation factor RimP [Paenarthrobacter sp. Z7-10]MCZ2403614.1 ribosome maturation factor RimP [Paenarthrobacter sp. Z7-10]